MNNKNTKKCPETKITHAGMRREVKDNRSKVLVPDEKSVKESRDWVQFTKL